MIADLLRWLGHHTPNISYVRAVPNLILKPIHLALGLGGGVVDVLGFRMRLNPRECVDAGLWFAPQFYDRSEIAYLLGKFPEQGVMLDVGANIGFWSLRFAHAFPNARICAIEANPATFELLCENIQLNKFGNIAPVHVGVSDGPGELPLYCNDTGNRGGDSFAAGASDRPRSVLVPVQSLASILAGAGLERIDIIKMDIEGLEERVLSNFFSETPRKVWPHFICAEVSHSPVVVDLLKKVGYCLVLRGRENCVFSLELSAL